MLPSAMMTMGSKSSLRAFTTSSRRSRAPTDDGVDDDDASPWGELDASVQEWELRNAKSKVEQHLPPQHPQQGQAHQRQVKKANGLSEDESMWLEAMNAKLDRAERTEQRAASLHAPGQTPSAASTSTSNLSADERMWLDAMNSKLHGVEGRATAAAPPKGYNSVPRIHTPAATSETPDRFQPAPSPSRTLTHVDECTNQPTMVNISDKGLTSRSATAVGRVYLPRSTLDLLVSSPGSTTEITSPAGKGPVFTTARLAGIMAAKKTADLIPLCHNISLDGVDLDFQIVDPAEITDTAAKTQQRHTSMTDEELTPYIYVKATATTRSATGVEMEALTAVQVASLTVWDMLKAVAGKDMWIGEVCVVAKRGGRSGDWQRAAVE